MCVVGTRAGREAVIARCNVRGGGPGKHRQHRARLRVDAAEKRARLVEHRVRRKQRFPVEAHAVVHIVSVEGEHRGVAHVEAGAAQHPELYGHIQEEDVLQPGAQLDLHQAPVPRGKALEHVGADEHPGVLEGRFEQRGGGVRVDDLAGLLKRRRDVPVVMCDPMAAGKAPARSLSDLASGLVGRL